jgi:hypothetical protein
MNTDMKKALTELLLETKILGFAEAVNKTNPAKVPASAVRALQVKVYDKTCDFERQFIAKAAMDFGAILKDMEQA